MRIAIVAAGFEPGEADRLRRAMATFRRVGTIGTFQTKMVEGMVARGYERDFAERCFRQIEGFGEYGFPESHAASFALLVYASCWMKCYYPDVFAAALLNSQPMGFYAPAQIVRDAKDHGVELRPVDINHSGWDNTLEPGQAARDHIHPRHRDMVRDIKTDHAIRLGFRQIKGIGEADADAIMAARRGGYDSVRDLWLRTGLKRATLEKLAEADAFRSIGLDRRDALWAVKGLDPASGSKTLPLFTEAGPDIQNEPDVALPPMPLGEHVINDYRFLKLSLKAHPAALIRDALAADRRIPCQRLDVTPNGRRVSVAGLVLVRQRPGSAKGVVFSTIEDETGIANIIIWPKVFEKYRPLVLGSRFIGVKGRMQSESGVIHVVAEQLEDLTPLLASLSEKAGEIEALANADEVRRPVEDIRQKIKPRSRLERLIKDHPELAADVAAISVKRTRRVLPKGRNFH